MILFSEGMAHNVSDKTFTQFMFEGFVIEVYKKARINEFIFSSCNAVLWTSFKKVAQTPQDVETEFLNNCNKRNVDKAKLVNFIEHTLDKYVDNLRKLTIHNIGLYNKGIVTI